MKRFSIAKKIVDYLVSNNLLENVSTKEVDIVLKRKVRLPEWTLLSCGAAVLRGRYEVEIDLTGSGYDGYYIFSTTSGDFVRYEEPFLF